MASQWTCVTCSHAATEDFCAHCGEKRHRDHDISFLHLGAEALEAFFHLDSKLLLTLRTLIRWPGKLTAEFFLGRRKPYYKTRLVWAMPMAVMLGFAGYYIMHLYRFVLFFTTLYTT